MSAPYSLSIFEWAGCFTVGEYETLTEACDAAVQLAFREYGRSQVIANGDGCEHDGERWHDGLDENERDALDAAIDAGARLGREAKLLKGAA